MVLTAKKKSGIETYFLLEKRKEYKENLQIETSKYRIKNLRYVGKRNNL